MANDTTNTTDEIGIEYPVDGYDGTPTWAELYAQAFVDIDDVLGSHATRHEKGGVDELTTFGDTTHDSVTTESLLNAADGGVWETLKLAGYEEGDRVVIESVTTLNEGSFTTSSGTFTDSSSTFSQVYVDLDHIPSDATLEARMLFETWTPMDVEGEFRAKFGTATTPAVSETNSFEDHSTEWVEIDVRERVKVRTEARSTNGTDSVSMALATFQFAVVL